MMRILKFNESNSYKEAKEIINTLYIVCDELTDEGIEWRISPDRDDDLRIKIIGLKLNSMWESDIYFYIDVNVSNLNEKQRIKVKEIFQTIENYSRSIGLSFEYKYLLSSWNRHYDITYITSFMDTFNYKLVIDNKSIKSARLQFKF
jgi:hypothetical protein